MKPSRSCAIVLLFVTACPYAFAETNQHHSVEGGYKASKLVGTLVLNLNGEELGRIEEIVIGATGLTGYAVLSFGGVLGVGDKLFAIPWSLFAHSPDKKHLTLDIPREKLEKAPGFNKREWPDMNDERWQTQLSDFYRTNFPRADASTTRSSTCDCAEGRHGNQ